MDKQDLIYLAGVIDSRSAIKLLRNYSPLKGYDGFNLKLRLRCGLFFAKQLHQVYGGNLSGGTLVLNSFKAEKLLQQVLPYLKEKQQEADIAISFSKARWIGNVTDRKIRRFELVRHLYFLQGGEDHQYLISDIEGFKTADRP
jgi:hypothetical protein